MRILVEAALQQPHDRDRCIRRQARPVGFALDHPGENLWRRLCRERSGASQQLVQHDAKGPDVGAAIDHPPLHLFRRHVPGRAKERAGPGVHVGNRRRIRDGAGRRGVGRLGQAEVEYLHGAVGAHHDVGGLQVAVDDPPLVGGLERLDDLLRDGQRIVQRDRPAREPLGEVLPFDELHRQRAPSTGRGRVFESVDLRDVRVVERRERASFPVEPRQPFLVPREQLGQDLDRDRPLQPAVDRLVDLAHASGTDPAYDLVRSDPVTDGNGHWGVGRIIPAKRGQDPSTPNIQLPTPNAPRSHQLCESRHDSAA